MRFSLLLPARLAGILFVKSPVLRAAIAISFLIVCWLGVGVAMRSFEEPPESSLSLVEPKTELRSGRVPAEAVVGVSPKRDERQRLRAIAESEGPEAALAAAKATGNDGQVLRLLQSLARSDPEWVAGVLMDSGLGKNHRGFVTDEILRHWDDGEKAVAWVESELKGDAYRMALGRALGILLRTDLDAALDHLDRLPPSGTRTQVVVHLFAAWGEIDPLAAVTYAEGMEELESRSAIGTALGRWSRQDVRAAAAWVKGHETPGATMISSIIRAWDKDSPGTLDEWLASIGDGPEKARALELVRESRMIESGKCTIPVGDPVALNTPRKFKPVSEMNEVELGTWAFEKQGTARAFVETSTYDPKWDQLIVVSTVLVAHGEGGPEAAWDWASGLPEGASDVALRAAVISWMRNEPAVVAAKVAALPPGRGARLADDVAENWSRQDPAAAAEWVESWSGEGKPELVRSVVQTWSNHDPHRAYRWLESLPGGESRDAGISYLLIRERDADAEVLSGWINLISDPKLREERRKIFEQR